MMKNKKILIVGGAGYIGGYLTDLFLDSGYNVTVYDNLTYESRYMKEVNFIYGDIRDTTRLEGLIHDFDIVVWLAAIVGDGACAVDVNLTHEINYETVKWLVDQYKGKIVFTSTCSVYGINHEIIDEETTPNPLSAYAETKLKAEQYIIAHAEDYLIFRLGTLFGTGDKFSRLRLDLVANILSMKAVQGEKLSVFGGEQWRPLLHVRDVSNAIKFGLEHELSGLFNLSCGNYTINDIAEKIKESINDIEINYTEMSFEDQRNYRVNCDKFNQYGWTPQFSLKDGIEEIIWVIGNKRIVDTTDIVYSNAAYVARRYDETRSI